MFRSQKTLYRNSKNRKIGGICAGIADYFELNVTIVRIIALCCLIFTLQVAVIVYLVAYFVLNDNPEALRNDDGKLRCQFRNNYERNSVLESVHDRFRNIEKRLRSIEAYVTSRRFQLKDEIDKL